MHMSLLSQYLEDAEMLKLTLAITVVMTDYNDDRDDMWGALYRWSSQVFPCTDKNSGVETWELAHMYEDVNPALQNLCKN